MFHGYYLLYQVIYVHLLTFSEIVSAIIDHFKHVLAPVSYTHLDVYKRQFLTCQCDLQFFGCFQCVIKQHFVKIPQAVK